MNDLKLIYRFYQYLKPYRLRIWLSLLCIPITIGCSIAFPILTIKAFEGLEKKQMTQEQIFVYIEILIAIIVVGYLSKTVFTLCLQDSGYRGLRDLREKLFSHTQRLPKKYYDNNPNGVILAKHTSDFEALGESLAIGVLGMITESIEVIALSIVLFFISYKLSLVLLIVLPPLFFIVSYLRKKLREAYQKARTHLADSTGYLQECLNGIKTIQLCAAEEEVQKKYNAGIQRFCLAQQKSNTFDALLFSIIEGTTVITLGLLLWFSKEAIDSNWLNIGVLLVFIHSFPKFFVPIRDFTQHLTVIQRSLAALEHIFSLLDEKAESENTQLFKPFEKIESIVFDKVWFRYKEQGPDVLKGVSFTIQKGQSYAIVGSTGSGKSTIIRLITKAYSDYQGSIKINGIELHTIPKSHLNTLIATMSQEPFLFNESIHFNIGLARPGLHSQTVQQAAQTVRAHDFITSFEQGYDFKTNQNGENLSAGQSQLISFARTIAGGQEFIILDEATSTVDSITEQSIEETTHLLFQHKTVIAIAHRLSTIRQADLILVMKDGEIIERGNHQKLYNLNGFYKKMIHNLEDKQR